MKTPKTHALHYYLDPPDSPDLQFATVFTISLFTSSDCFGIVHHPGQNWSPRVSPQSLHPGCALGDEDDALDNLSGYLPIITSTKTLILHCDLEGGIKESKPIHRNIRGNERPVAYMDSPILGATVQAPPIPESSPIRHRRSALAIAERVGSLVSLRRGSLNSGSRSRSRGSSDPMSPQSPASATAVANIRSASSSTLHLATSAQNFLGSLRSTRASRDNSACNTDHEEDHETTSEDIHSIADSLEFGLLEGDPFANLSTPPSECHSPATRSWIRTLSSDVITEEPDEQEESRGNDLGPGKKGGDSGALDGFATVDSLWLEEEEEEGNYGDVSTHEVHPPTRTPASSPERDLDGTKRGRSNSFTQRVRNVMQSRPSLPSLSLLANTKIFIPTASSKSGLASRFPSEPWDDPKWSFSAGANLPDGTANVVTVPSHAGSGGTSSGGGGSGGYGGESTRESRSDGSRARNFPSRSVGGRASGDGDGDGWQPPRRSGPTSHSAAEGGTPNGESDEDSDDQPLGQRPNALSAQKSLRKQMKDERRSRKETIKQTAHSLLPAFISGPTKAPAPVKLSADDLTARLLHLRANVDSLPSSPTGRTAFPTLPTHSNGMSPQVPAQSPPALNVSPSKNENMPSPSLVPTSTFAFPLRGTNPVTPSAIRRHATDSRAHRNTPSTSDTTRPKLPQRSITSFDFPRGSGANPNDGGSTSAMGTPAGSRRPSHEIASKMQSPPNRSRADTLIQKMSMQANYAAKFRERANSLQSARSPRAPVPPVALPPLPTPAQVLNSSTRSAPISQDSNADSYGSGSVVLGHSETLMQQRVFVGNMQRFSVVEIGARTNAREVIADVMAKGDLTSEEARSGDWMLFEIANDFGMERPIREFEVVMEVYNSWNSETRLNYFMLKQTNQASLLAASAIPKSSPTFGGYVEWEHKRGRWTKRWLELREHGLWLSKRQGAKDAAVLCTLANFDAYTVTRVHKSPKPFSFSVKSVQNMRLFENLSDYHHVFSCDAQEGAQWLQNILLARSYVLRQERTVLFRSLNPPLASRDLARSSTKRTAPAPLVHLDSSRPLAQLPAEAQSPGLTAPDAFNPIPGSLLAKRI